MVTQSKLSYAYEFSASIADLFQTISLKYSCIVFTLELVKIALTLAEDFPLYNMTKFPSLEVGEVQLFYGSNIPINISGFQEK